MKPLAAVLLVAACACTTAQAATAGSIIPVSTVATEALPYRMDTSNQAGWWKPVAVHGGRVFVAFNGPAPRSDRHRVWVASRPLAGGEWRRGCLRLRKQRRCVTYQDDIGHNQPTIAVDGRGFIHVFASMHHSSWQGHYFRSRRARWVTTMRSSNDLWPRHSRFTYPVAATSPSGDVWLLARQSGIDPVLGRMYRWDADARRWHAERSFAAASPRGVYPDDVVFSPDGRVHLVWSWSGGGAGGVKHAGSYIVYDPDSRSYANAAGEPVASPATPDSPTVFQPLETGEDWSQVMDGYGQRGAKLALTADGRPFVVYRYQAPADGSTAAVADEAKMRTAEWNGTEWVRTDVYDGRTSEGFGVTVHDDGARVYYDDRPSYATSYLTIDGAQWPVTSGTSAVVTAGGADIVYRSVPSQRTLYVGIN